jgi:hypothetical protein
VVFEDAADVGVFFKNAGAKVFVCWDNDEDVGVPQLTEKEALDWKKVAFGFKFDKAKFHFACKPFGPSLDLGGYKMGGWFPG